MERVPRTLIATTMAYPHTGGASTHIDALIGRLGAASAYAGVCEGERCFPTRAGRLGMLIAALGNNDHYAVRLHIFMIDALRKRIEEALRGDERIEIIHCHDHRAALAARRAVLKIGRLGHLRPAIVQTIHGPWLFELRQTGDAPEGGRQNAYVREHESASFRAADGLIAVDSGQKQIAIELGADPVRVTVIYNAVSLEELEAAAVQPSTIEAEKPYFVVPRRLVPKTGVRFAVEAMAEIPKEKRPRLLVAGQGPQREELEGESARLGLAAWVRFLGPVPRDRLVPLMAGAAGVLVPSVPAGGVVEATSLAVIEAMALRVPAIASAIGGLAELIQHERTGLLVPAANPALLAEAMVRVIDGRLPPDLIPAARERVEKMLSTGPWFESVLGVYRKALAAR